MDELKGLGGEGLALFSLALRFGLEDLTSIAAEAITDGKNDKKIDVLYVDKTLKSAFIIQCYLAEGKFDKSAPMNKATDLHAAVSYAISVGEQNIPDKIKPQIKNFRQSIEEGDVDTVYIWYVHNRTEDKRIEAELNQVEIAALAALKASFSAKSIRVISQEVGSETLKDWYDKSGNAIVVSDKITFDGLGSYESKGPSWKCLVTSVSGQDLYELYKKYEKDLFSLNVRDYLGIVKKDANVNNGIRKTAGEQPQNFWAFNNGITAIVHDYEIDENRFTVTGLSIVNGAQTTGAIGNLEGSPEASLRVPARFFKTADQNIIDSIIRYNNSQNAIEASDFRSTDNIQRRLKDEFAKIPNADYEGGRRGSVSDAIKRRPNLLPSYTVGQALSAFHGDPVIAYNEKSRIWSDNSAYERIFNDAVSAEHIILCFSLLRAIENRKNDLLKKSKRDNATLDEQEQNEMAYFRQKGSQFFLMYIVAHCMDQILKKPIPNKFKLAFKTNNVINAQHDWKPILDVFLAFAPKIGGYLSDGLKSNERSKQAADDVRQTLQAIIKYNEPVYDDFAKTIKDF